ncbi:expressed unknown protein [Seminavis robusta]|uniref:Uncharacterized protein n=1 Tax=Seminavis robusta TaxID=568900 RepID=A0A9N8H0A5_9STRA|nr:expressed unknown protein [Seminavis robusta]|eukprot:Sro17_g012390.1 n/a (265) ;mRNA; r:94807-95601
MGRKNKRAKSLPGNLNQNEGGFDKRLATVLLAKGFVSSPEESICLAESMVAEIEESDLSRNEACIAAFEDYFSMSRQGAMTTLSSLLDLVLPVEDKKDGNDNSSQEGETAGEDAREAENDDDDDGEYIGEGECELCERFIRLTHHHLIPRSTWPRILPRLTNAAEALSRNDVNRAGLILGPGLLHLLEPLTRADSDRGAIKDLLKRTCRICGACHGHIHRTHDNMTLATDFSSTENLLSSPKIYDFSKWANKQKAGRYSYSHSM